MQHPLEAIRTYLLGDAAITAIVSQKVFIHAVPANQIPPLLILIPITAMGERIISGSLTARSFRFSVECRSGSVLQANSLGGLVFQRLDNATGTLGGVAFDRIQFDSEANLYEDATLTARRILDFHAHT
jgi:hypothetical protein